MCWPLLPDTLLPLGRVKRREQMNSFETLRQMLERCAGLTVQLFDAGDHDTGMRRPVVGCGVVRDAVKTAQVKPAKGRGSSTIRVRCQQPPDPGGEEGHH